MAEQLDLVVQLQHLRVLLLTKLVTIGLIRIILLVVLLIHIVVVVLIEIKIVTIVWVGEVRALHEVVIILLVDLFH